MRLEPGRALRVAAQPLPPRLLLPVSLALALAVAGYCFAYNWMGGHAEPIGAGLVWPAVNVVPWFIAWEAAKRARSRGSAAAALLAALLASLTLHLLA
jgi:hypothetical protein